MAANDSVELLFQSILSHPPDKMSSILGSFHLADNTPTSSPTSFTSTPSDPSVPATPTPTSTTSPLFHEIWHRRSHTAISKTSPPQQQPQCSAASSPSLHRRVALSCTDYLLPESSRSKLLTPVHLGLNSLPFGPFVAPHSLPTLNTASVTSQQPSTSPLPAYGLNFVCGFNDGEGGHLLQLSSLTLIDNPLLPEATIVQTHSGFTLSLPSPAGLLQEDTTLGDLQFMDSSRFFVSAGSAVSLIKVHWQGRHHEVVARLEGFHSATVTSMHYSAHLLSWTDLESFYSHAPTRALGRQRSMGSAVTAVKPHLTSKSFGRCVLLLWICASTICTLDWQTVFASTQDGQAFADDHRQPNPLPLIKEVRQKVRPRLVDRNNKQQTR